MSHSMSHDDAVAWWADGGEGGRQQSWCESQHDSEYKYEPHRESE